MDPRKHMVKIFERETGLKVKEFLEHRTVEWGRDNPSELFVFKVAGKKNSAFMLFESNKMKTWGYIFPCARYGLKNDDYD